ncbi:MAG TPA: FGGY family carbohydrate kinase [Tepidisphaeraceae bacterium]|jgi:xylulokinase
MNLLALDVGSSSVKAAILKRGEVTGKVARAPFDTHYDGVKVEVDARAILKAIAAAIAQVGPAAKRVQTIGLTVMAPSWVAIDKKGKALTPVITHQDRRSTDVARDLEKRVGKSRHLKLAGNRPFPGGISSTTWAWYRRHAPEVMKRADLVGHLNTFLHRHLTHSRVIDPSNASFMGVYSTCTLDGWNEELMDAVGAGEHELPQLMDADAVGGLVTHEAGRDFGLTHGTPVLVGCMDGSAAMLLAGNKPGQLVNVCGSTDVLALCTDEPTPHEKLLTRAIGVGPRWVSVSTIASAGSSLTWAKDNLFADLSVPAFRKRVARLGERPLQSSVRFEPYLAGERTSVDQRQGAFTGLTLATTREEMLSAIIESLATTSAARLPLLAEGGTKFLPTVYVTGGVSDGLADLLHRDWPGHFKFQQIEEATLRGVGRMVPQN